MVKTESELDRLKREVNWLQRKHVLIGREHREEKWWQRTSRYGSNKNG